MQETTGGVASLTSPVVATSTFKGKGEQECSFYRELIQVGAATIQGCLIVAVAVGSSPSFPSIFIGTGKITVA